MIYFTICIYVNKHDMKQFFHNKYVRISIKNNYHLNFKVGMYENKYKQIKYDLIHY